MIHRTTGFCLLILCNACQWWWETFTWFSCYSSMLWSKPWAPNNFKDNTDFTSLIHRWDNWGKGWLHDSSKATQMEGTEVGFKARETGNYVFLKMSQWWKCPFVFFVVCFGMLIYCLRLMINSMIFLLKLQTIWRQNARLCRYWIM